jgi:uncharacterized 2Fe-2S/4Fe-4S cluster protein (DUF4445 family)
MALFKVLFQPDAKTVEVEGGATLLAAAEAAGVFVNSICGGQGLCGECRLRVIRGEAKADKHAIGFFSSDEVKQGYVLACQTPVTGDLEVEVPARSRLEMEQIITDSGVNYSEPGKIALHRRDEDPAKIADPLVRKHYLELPEPSLEDNVSDVDRVTRALRQVTPYREFEISLACLRELAATLRSDDWKVTATVARHDATGRVLAIEGGDRTAVQYGLAVDVGTTTIVVQLIDLWTGEVCGVEGNHNLQAHYGEDVISRMVFACGRGSLDPLHDAVVTNINLLTKALVQEKGIELNDIHAIVAAGNTTMSHFLLGLMPCAIRLEPYVPTATVYPQVLAREAGIQINPDAILEVMPSVSSYVGGDIVAGILACGLGIGEAVTCLIDVGTNGEIAVGNAEWIVTCSASAGPAFEGGGTKWGMRAAKGAIEALEIKDGKVDYHTIGKAKARGICGSGLIDAIYELARHGIIGKDGKFNTGRPDPRVIVLENLPQYVIAPANESESGQAVTVTEADIANLVKSKGAVFAALKSLVDYTGLGFEAIDKLYLAGGFGSSLDIPKAVAIGLLPDIPLEKIEFIGNSSLMGARMVLLSGPAYEASITTARRMTNIELSNYPKFMSEFIAALFLPHTDAALFPSVKY